MVRLKIFRADTVATPGALASSIIDAIAYTAASHIPIALVETNLTIEGDFDASDVAALKGAFYNAHHSGVTVICTAGNANPG